MGEVDKWLVYSQWYHDRRKVQWLKTFSCTFEGYHITATFAETGKKLLAFSDLREPPEPPPIQSPRQLGMSDHGMVR